MRNDVSANRLILRSPGKMSEMAMLRQLTFHWSNGC